jgi:biotin transport system substrate-specific component
MQHQVDSRILSIPDRKIYIQAIGTLTFVILTALGAQLEIPTHPVPFTLQTFFVLVAGVFLGNRGGALSMGLYIVLGILGVPLFSGGSFGLAVIAGPTGGYLLSFPVAAWVVGYLTTIRHEYWWMLISMTIGSFIIFSLGTFQLNFVLFHNWMNSLNAGFFIFSWWDGLKILASASIAYSYFLRIQHRLGQEEN